MPLAQTRGDAATDGNVTSVVLAGLALELVQIAADTEALPSLSP